MRINTTFFLLFCVQFVFAQNVRNVVLGLGSSTYFGELNPYNRPISSLISRSIRWNVHTSYSHPITQRFSLTAGFSYIRLSGDDNYSNNIINYVRNLHFRNDLKEFSLKGRYYFGNIENSYQSKYQKFFYLTGGINFLFHNPKARGVTSGGNRKSSWTNLRQLNNEEAFQTYSTNATGIPFGFGVNIKFSNRISVTTEILYNTLFTDYIDDVSKYFAVDNTGKLSNRTAETIAANTGNNRIPRLLNYLDSIGYSGIEVESFTRQFENGVPPFVSDLDLIERGNPKVKDSYLLLKVGITYYFKPHIKCPKIL